MTLVEMMITVSIIGLLAGIMTPAIRHSIRQRENLQAAEMLRTAVSAFQLYASEQSEYPPDRTQGVTPPEMAAYYFPYFKIDDWWEDSTPLGGNWDWDNGYHYAYSVSIRGPERSSKQLERFDAMIDDGDLSTGTFRKQGIQYHFILEE
jgi:prepilin-type N-terminal cleavage/methylation domain-containing protein